MSADLESLKSVKQLVQAQPPNTNAYSIFSKSNKHKKVVITSIMIANTSANAIQYSLFLDKDGTTYSTGTALASSVSLGAHTSALLEFNNGLPIDPGAAGNLAVQVDTANAVTFTVNGIEANG